jgi:uncharacterized delta-60 repeat protein
MRILYRIVLLICFTILAFSFAHAQVDLTFAPKFIKNGYITVVRPQTDGKIIITGDFTQVGSVLKNKIFRLNADGSVDASFDAGSGPNKDILDLYVQADGKILVAGQFTEFDGKSAPYLVRLNSNGSIDNTFSMGTGPSDLVAKLAKRPAGGFIIHGFFSKYNNKTANYLTAINDDGSLVDGFDPNAGKYINDGSGFSLCSFTASVVVQPDGKILYTNCDSKGFVRLNADGTLDGSFALPANILPRETTAHLQADGKIVLAGSFTSFEGSSSVSRVVRLNTDGSKDATFTVFSVTGSLDRSAITPDGKILLVRKNSTYSLDRLTSNGAIDGTFPSIGLGPNTSSGSVRTLVTQADGTIWLGGAALTIATQNQSLFKLNANGTVASTPVPLPGLPAIIYDAVVDNIGNILVIGDFISVNNQPKNNIVRITATGQLDPTFSPAINSITTSYPYYAKIRVQSTGKILVASSQIDVTSVGPKNGIIRLNSNGSYDASFAPSLGLNSNSVITILDVRADDKVLFGGNFTNANAPTGNLVLLNSTGTNDATFSVSSSVLDFTPYTNLITPDNKIIVGGLQNNDGSSGRNGKLIKLTSAGAIDPDFKWDAMGDNYNLTNFYPVTLQKATAGFLVGGGPSKSYGPGDVDYFIYVDNSGKTRKEFTPNVRNITNVYAAIELANGNVLYAGDSYEPTQNFVHILTPQGGESAVSGLNINGTIKRILPLDAGRLAFFGNIKRVNGEATFGAFAYTISTPTGTVSALQGVAAKPTKVTLTWIVTGAAPAFEIYRSSQIDNGFAKIGNSTSAQFTDNDAVPGSVNYYKVRIINAANSGAFSDAVPVETPAAILAAPTNFIAKLLPSSYNSVELRWIASAASPYNIEIERAENLSDLSNPFRSTATGKTITLDGLSENKDYFFRIRLSKGTDFSAYTDFVKVTTGPSMMMPPFGFTATNAGTQAILSWSDTTKASQGFEIWRAESTSFFRKIAEVEDPFFIDENAAPNDRYSYAVRSFGSRRGYAVFSEFTAIISVFVPDPISGGAWTPKTSIPVTRSDASSFSLGNFGYVGLGYNGSFLKDFYKFDPLANTWTAVATFPGAQRSRAITFVINGKAYVGGGNGGGNNGLKDFYSYDAQSNSWQPLADIPNDDAGNPGILNSVSFATGGKGYITMITRTGGILTRELMEYTPETNTWVKRLDFPGALKQSAVAIEKDGIGYVGLGGTLTLSDEWWAYTPSTNTWTKKSSASSNARKSAVGVNYIGQMLVLTGDNSSTLTSSYQSSTSFYRSVPWDYWTSSALPSVTTARAGATAFVIGDKLYLGTGYNGSYLADMQQYTSATSFTPGAISNLKATYISGTEADLSWKFNGQLATGLQLELSTDNGISYSAVSTLSSSVVRYKLVGLIPNKKYYIRIRASLMTTNGVYVTSSFFTKPLPTAASNAGAVAQSSSSISLTWNDNSDTETAFEIWRSEVDFSGAVYVYVASTTSNAVTFTDVNLKPEVRYYYKVRAVNEAGKSDFTLPASATTLKSTPPVPEALIASNPSSTTVKLSWTYNIEETVTATQIYTSTDGVSYFYSAEATGLNALVIGLTSSKKYYFKVRNVNGTVYSNFSAVVEQTTLDPIPTMPTNLAGKALTDTSIELTWQYGTPTTEDGFIVQRSTAMAGPFVSIDSVLISERRFVDQEVVTLQTYSYRLLAYSTGGNSLPTAVVTVFAKSLPAAPTEFVAKRDSLTRIVLTWKDNAVNEEGYIVESFNFTTNVFVAIDTLPPNSVRFLHSKLMETKQYRYVIKAYNVAGFTSSNVADVLNIVVGVEEESVAKSIQVFPNPGDGRYHITTNGRPWSVKIINSIGASILESSGETTQAEVDIRDFPAGIYFFHVKTQDRAVVRKIIKRN